MVESSRPPARPSRKAFAALLALVICVALLTGCDSRPVGDPSVSSELMIRGYIAVAVGRTARAKGQGLHSEHVAGKDVYLPGVMVYVENISTGASSEPRSTDLSGRFSVYAPEPGEYRLCWKSDVYGDGCLSDNHPILVKASPQFLSTVYIPIPRIESTTAATGRVTLADGHTVRLYEPMLNVNAFATVSVVDKDGITLAEVPVNNFGDYLLPYLPTDTQLLLTTQIESERFTQEILPEAELGGDRVHQVNLRFTNYAPRIDPLTAFDASNKRVQNAAPGDIVTLRANGRDRNGDAVKYRWFVDGSAGSLSGTTGPTVDWALPAAPGRYSITVVGYDGRGGYDKATLSLLADGKGIPFGGLVVDQSGGPVPDAEIEIVGNPVVTTNASGRFRTRVGEAQRYVLNIRKKGFALNSRIYDRGVTAGRWILRRGQIVIIDPTKTGTITHERDKRNCLGPSSVRAPLGIAGESLLVPQWQDGKGNVIDPPQARVGYERGRQAEAVLPRRLELPPCGPGVSITIGANTIVDADGNLVGAPFEATISTVDLLSPQQMPGDESVIPAGGGGGYIESFGAGALDLPAGFKLTAPAEVVIPVDRSRQMGGASLPANVPYLTYDEKQGLWIEEGVLTLKNVGGVQSYVGEATHFTPFNADNVKDATSSCVRVFSPTLPGDYDLEVSAPLSGGGVKILKKSIENTSPYEYVIYNLPNNSNITLAPMTQGANPQLLGYYVVNSGPIQVPPSSPLPPAGPPYDACNNFVVLSVGQAPSSPFGGEFLHGIGFIDGANLGFDDLTAAAPTGDALRDAIVDASRNYYTAIDPNGDFDTFDKFKAEHGFNPDPTTPEADEIVVAYANSGDLGFGRDMHCKDNSGVIACYVTNYGNGYVNIADATGGGGGTSDIDDADAAEARDTVGGSAEVATVAMEYGPIDGAGPSIVKFYVYKKNFPNPGDYDRSISANLDGRGERPVPQLCMVCHGGLIPDQAGGVPAFGTPDQVNFSSRFVPFDHRLFTFPGDLPPNAAQEAAIKSLNQEIVDQVPAGAPANDPIREVIAALYSGGAVNQQANSPVPGWQAGGGENAPGQTDFYNDVFTSACRTCHMSQPFPKLNFRSSSTFIHLANNPVPSPNHLMLGTVQSRVCGDYIMPHALRTHDIFWGRYTDINPAIAGLSMPALLQSFGDGIANPNGTWDPNLCTSFISATVSAPSNFYQQSIQPIWNGKCVGCHIAGGGAPAGLPLTQGNSWDTLVPGGKVIPGDDTAGALILRTTAANPNSRMPPDCFRAPEPDNGELPCLLQSDIDRIRAWIRSGAN